MSEALKVSSSLSAAFSSFQSIPLAFSHVVFPLKEFVNWNTEEAKNYFVRKLETKNRAFADFERPIVVVFVIAVALVVVLCLEWSVARVICSACALVVTSGRPPSSTYLLTYVLKPCFLSTKSTYSFTLLLVFTLAIFN